MTDVLVFFELVLGVMDESRVTIPRRRPRLIT
jgi:hypothetical protein